MNRIAALFAREMLDLRLNPAVFLPVAIVGVVSLVLPFLIAVIIPALTGERLSDSADFRIALEMYREDPRYRGLAPEAAVQAWLFQQFLLFLLIVPVVEATAVAAHSVVGEKNDRTLEPLLATPITTFELLAGKALAAWLPAVALALTCFGVYLGLIAWLAEPGVARVLLSARSVGVVLLLGPLAALAALQLTICVSSRASDERSAQQWGSLIVLPIAATLIAPFLGAEVTVPIVLGASAVLVVVNAVLMRIAIRVFDRESILTRWK